MLIVTFALPLLGVLRIAPSSQPPVPPVQLASVDWGEIGSLMRTAEYQATPRTVVGGQPAFWAPNHANNLSLSFGPAGLEVAPEQGGAVWSLRLRAAAYGPAGATSPLAGVPVLSADAERVEYRWAALSEWYTNGPAGLKHNITLSKPVAADRLQVDLALTGTLRAQVAPDGQSVRFLDRVGATALDFGPLLVYDAAGTTLPARFTAPVVSDSSTTLPILIDAAGASFPITVDPLLSSPRPRVGAADPEAAASFGQELAIDGDTLVVGAPSKDERGRNSGAVYVFTRNRGGADQWEQVRKLVPADGAASDGFGRAVAIDGDTIVVGAPLAQVLTPDDGAVYIFERDRGGPDSWGQRQKLELARDSSGNSFGAAVAISEGVIVVGAPSDNVSVVDAGAVYSYSYAGASVGWQFERGILPSERLSPGASFGRSVALDGSLLVVGAPFQGPFDNSTGAAYLFRHTHANGGRWLEERKLVGDDSRSLDSFGTAVAVAGDRVVIGSPRHDVNGMADRGAAYLFEHNTVATGWGQTAKLTDTTGAAGDLLGVAVDVDAERVVVGAHFDDDEARGLNNSGSLSVFIDGRFFVKLTPPGGAGGDNFGVAVAIAGDLVVGGASKHDSGATDAGASFLFSLASETWSEIRRHEGLQGCCIALDGDTLAVGTKSGAEGLIVIFRRNSDAANGWGELKRFSVPTDPAGALLALALDGDTLAVQGDRVVRIFGRNEGGRNAWGLQRQIVIGSSQGIDLALEGDSLLVGEPAMFGGSGAIEMFQRDQGGENLWGQAQVLTPDDIPADVRLAARFGGQVALDGTTLVVLSSSPPPPGSSLPGLAMAHVFQRPSARSGWQFVRRLQPAEPVPGLPATIAVDGDTIAVSTRPLSDSTRQFLPNSVSLFRRHAGGANAWGQIRRLPLPPEARSFGSALALDNDLLAVGATQADLGLGDKGAVFLFERNIGGPEGWGQLTALTGSPAAGANELGIAVALDDDRMVAGSNTTLYVFNNGVRKPAGLELQAAGPTMPGRPVDVVATLGAVASGEGAPAEGLGAPRGEVSFFLNGEAVGAAPLDAEGRAALTLPGLPDGVHELTARFPGSANWAPCEAPALILYIGVQPPPLAVEVGVFLPLIGR